MDAWPLLTRIWKLQRDLLQKAAPCIEELSVSPRELMLLAFVERCPSPSGLARELRIPTPSVSHALKRLEKRGLLERQTHPEDLRRFNFALTETGKSALERGQECLKKSFLDSLARLRPEEREEFDRLLYKLTEDE
ncbi:MarR family winged helix-turn-helix transcriptional regulator [Oceanithermus sp.]